MSDSELVVYGFCAGFFVAELLIAWLFLAHRPKPPNAPTDEAERWTYTVVDDGAIYVGEEPKLERTVWLSTIEHHTGRVQSAALVAIAHNKPEARN
jgi:hypothetical protein